MCGARPLVALHAKNGGICVMMSNSTFLRPAGSKPAIYLLSYENLFLTDDVHAVLESVELLAHQVVDGS